MPQALPLLRGYYDSKARAYLDRLDENQKREVRWGQFPGEVIEDAQREFAIEGTSFDYGLFTRALMDCADQANSTQASL